MASLKLLYRDEWRRLPRAPDTWCQLAAELREMYTLEWPGVVEIGGNKEVITGEMKYRELLSRAEVAGTKLLKLEVVQGDPGPKLIATFHLPECSRCMGRLSGREELYQLACGHIFCGLCFYQITQSQDVSVCPFDFAQAKGVQNRELSAKIQQLAVGVGKISPLYYDLPPALMQLYESVFREVRTERVPCVFFAKSQSCPDQEHCRYQHGEEDAQLKDKTTSFERVMMKDAFSSSIPVESRQVGTVPIATEDSGTHPNPIPMQDQVTTTAVRQDSGSDAVLFVDQANATVPLEFKSAGTSSHVMVSVQQETVPMVTQSQLSGPGEPRSEFSQAEYEAGSAAQMDFLQELRTSIRMAVTESNLTVYDRFMEEFPVSCNECGMRPIPEHFFHCSQCAVILCPACEEVSEHLHPMYKVKHISQMQRSGLGPKSERVDDQTDIIKRLENMGFKDSAKISRIVQETGDFNRAVEILLSPQ